MNPIFKKSIGFASLAFTGWTAKAYVESRVVTAFVHDTDLYSLDDKQIESIILGEDRSRFTDVTKTFFSRFQNPSSSQEIESFQIPETISCVSKTNLPASSIAVMFTAMGVFLNKMVGGPLIAEGNSQALTGGVIPYDSPESKSLELKRNLCLAKEVLKATQHIAAPNFLQKTENFSSMTDAEYLEFFLTTRKEFMEEMQKLLSSSKHEDPEEMLKSIERTGTCSNQAIYGLLYLLKKYNGPKNLPPIWLVGNKFHVCLCIGPHPDEDKEKALSESVICDPWFKGCLPLRDYEKVGVSPNGNYMVINRRIYTMVEQNCSLGGAYPIARIGDYTIFRESIPFLKKF